MYTYKLLFVALEYTDEDEYEIIDNDGAVIASRVFGKDTAELIVAALNTYKAK